MAFSSNQKKSFLLDTPDALLGADEILEVKCPYGGRQSMIRPGKLISFPKIQDSQTVLKTNHNYYYQIQGQLAITERSSCRFCVYTHKDFFSQIIMFDKNFYEKEMLPKLDSFWQNHYKPYIASQL